MDDFRDGKILEQNDRFILTSNCHVYDTNFHLFDCLENLEYLIDSSDLHDFLEDGGLQSVEGVLFEDLKELSWKTENAKFLL